MKKNKLILIMIMISIFVTACGAEEREVRGRFAQEDEETPEKTDDEDDPEDIAAETDASNRKIFAEMFGIDENDESLKYIMASLKNIGAGRIQSAVIGTDKNDEEYVDVIAEDGTNFRMYLFGGYSVRDVKNLDTGEWVMRSYQ